jgi:outer membrane lipoprotein LolB
MGLIGGIGLLTACSSVPTVPAPSTGTSLIREGRLFLRVDSTPPTVTQADISLQGTAEAGQLTLFGPLGITQGSLRWGPGEAVWTRGAEERRFNSLDSLLTQTLGTALPVPTVFAWLEGQAVELDGWELLSLPSDQHPLVARRLRPAPTLELRLRLTP